MIQWVHSQEQTITNQMEGIAMKTQATITEYAVTLYWDVWGNVEDGWEVNDCSQFGENLAISDDWTDDDILDALIDLDILTAYKDLFIVTNLGEAIEIERKDDNKPLVGLRPIYD